MENLLGVRVKVWESGKVAVLLFKKEGDQVLKFYLDNDGDWQPVGEGETYPGINKTYFERPDVGF